jgi:23S rRNA pseudouridine2457 synthase
MRYILFYKPYEVLSQFSASEDKKTLAHFFNSLPKDVYPAGRLDFDSEGLILLTSDKALAHKLNDPRFAHRRTYYVQVEGSVSDEALLRLSAGVDIQLDGKKYRTLPAAARLLPAEPALPPRFPPIRFRKSVPTSWLSLTLREGKNRQVRRMTAAVGFPTLRLVRYAIGRVTIEGMQPGDFIEADQRLVQDLLR